MLNLAILVLGFLAISAHSKWTQPTLLMWFKNFIRLASVYRDPGSSLTHAIIQDEDEFKYIHLAVADSGTVVHKHAFQDRYGLTAIIRGAGDGRRLYLALCYSPDKNNLITRGFNLTESLDGGKTWLAPVNFVTDRIDRFLSDMVYMPKTGRIFVFFAIGPSNELRMASRKPGSAVFSPDTLVAKNVYSSYHHARAGYGLCGARECLHAAYVDAITELVMYTRSLDLGATWEAPKQLTDLNDAYAIVSLVSGPELGSGVYIYYDGKDMSSRMFYSADSGSTFQPHLTVTKEATWWNPAGMAACGNGKVARRLVSLYSNGSYGLEYNYWDTADMKPKARETPYTNLYAQSAGVDCVVRSGMRSVSTFATHQCGRGCWKLYFALERETESGEQDS